MKVNDKILLAKADQLEETIAKAIRAFCDETGTTADVVEIDVELLRTQKIGEQPRTLLTRVSMEVKV
jgi:hypothetical protein